MYSLKVLSPIQYRLRSLHRYKRCKYTYRAGAHVQRRASVDPSARFRSPRLRRQDIYPSQSANGIRSSQTFIFTPQRDSPSNFVGAASPLESPVTNLPLTRLAQWPPRLPLSQTAQPPHPPKHSQTPIPQPPPPILPRSPNRTPPPPTTAQPSAHETTTSSTRCSRTAASRPTKSASRSC